MNAENVTSILVISPHTIVRPCATVTDTSPSTGKEYLQ